MREGRHLCQNSAIQTLFYVKMILSVRRSLFPSSKLQKSTLEKGMEEDKWREESETAHRGSPDPQIDCRKGQMVMRLKNGCKLVKPSARADPLTARNSDSLEFFIQTPIQVIFGSFSNVFSIQTQLRYPQLEIIFTFLYNDWFITISNESNTETNPKCVRHFQYFMIGLNQLKLWLILIIGVQIILPSCPISIR